MRERESERDAVYPEDETLRKVPADCSGPKFIRHVAMRRNRGGHFQVTRSHCPMMFTLHGREVVGSFDYKVCAVSEHVLYDLVSTSMLSSLGIFFGDGMWDASQQRRKRSDISLALQLWPGMHSLPR